MTALSENPMINVVTAAATLHQTIDLTGKAPADQAIQTVIDNSPRGAKIYFPAGIYSLNATIRLKYGQRYEGANSSTGPNGTIITQGTNQNLSALFASYEFMSNSAYCGEAITVEQITFDGNSQNNVKRFQWNDQTGSTTNAYGVNNGLILLGYRSRIRDCFFFNLSGCGIIVADMTLNGTGIRNTAVENRLEQCIVEGFGYYGIFVSNATGACTDGYMRDCIVDGDPSSAKYAGSDCIHINNGAGWFLSGNHVYGGAEGGIIISHAFATTVIANEVDGYGNGPIFPYSQAPYYYAGLAVTCNSGTRGAVLVGNVIYCDETLSNVYYQHLCLTANYESATPTNPAENTRIIASNNIVIGNYQSSRPANHSVGIVIQDLSSQNVPSYMIVYGNRVDMVGQDFYTSNDKFLFLEPCQVIASVVTTLDVQTNRHLISGGTTAPKLIKGANNNTNSPRLDIVGNDVRGVITFTSGSNQGEQVQLLFVQPYTSPPVVMLTPQSSGPVITAQSASSPSGSATSVPSWYVWNVSTTGFSIGSTTSLTSATYNVAYYVIG